MVARLILAGAPLHPAVVTALRAAAAEAGARPVDTRDLLVALMRADQSGEWSRIWLHTGDIDAVAGTVAVDPEPASSAAWDGIPVTDTCAIALDVGGRLAFRYNLWPIPVGLIAIGLVADPTSAAGQALGGGVEHAELLRMLQSEILGMPLSGLDVILPTVLGEARAAHRGGSASPNPPAAPRRRGRILIPLAIGLAVLGLIGQWGIDRMLHGDHDSAALPSTTTTYVKPTAVPLQVGTAAPDGSRLDIHVPAGTELAVDKWPDGCTLLTDAELRAILPQATNFHRTAQPLELIGVTNGHVDMHKGYIPRAGCEFGFQLPRPLQPNALSTTEGASLTVMMLGIVDPSLTDQLYEKDRDPILEREMTDIGNAWGPDACYTWHNRGDTKGGDYSVACRQGQYYFEVSLNPYTALPEFQGGAANFAKLLPELVKTVSARLS
ncbi:hypothetical protein VMT65_12030 [Nocardia sp. CDC153]|uniref:hypothetical protein n=1 Tax=Nocardia sp. CDC153 TaxID=3112167 RepID=UPI002DB81B09|nr:hypothetical protein [Nocardia sp. CDC153]MEC3953760.1 hypothetical protein [Nocardia sp. CDC153]